MTMREIFVTCVSLAVVGFAIFLPHILHGGLYLDDWVTANLTLHPPGDSSFTSTLSNFNDLLSSCRPALILFIPLKYILFGTDLKALLSLSVVLAVLAAALMYAVLRVLGVPWYHAWLISALTVAFPWFDSTRFWESTDAISFSVALAFAGLWIALIGLSRNSWRLHAVAVLLYLLSMLTYEFTLPFIAAIGVLYVARGGWRAARFRWAADLAAVLAAGLWNSAHTPKTVSSLAGDIEHLKQIVTQGGELIARAAFPVGAQPHTSIILALLGGTFLVGIAAYLLLPAARTTQHGWGLRNWLLLAGGGFAAACLGWIILIPADPYYTPSIFGVTNRVNGFAGFGLVVFVYAVLGIAGTLFGQALGRIGKSTSGGGWVTPLSIILLGLCLGAAYIHVLERHGRLWDEAYSYERSASEQVHNTFPNPLDGTTIFGGNYPTNVTLGVVVFETSWDFDAMLKLTYANQTLHGYPITEETGVGCLANGMRWEGEEAPMARYGTARFLNLETGASSLPRSRAECIEQRSRYAAGPLYLATAY